MANPTYLLSVSHPILSLRRGVPPSTYVNSFWYPNSKLIVYFLCLQQDLYLSVAIKFLTAEPALDVEELLGGFLS